jgi:hypothetical protein
MNVVTIKFGNIAHKLCQIDSDMNNRNITISKLHSFHAILVQMDKALLEFNKYSDKSDATYKVACCMRVTIKYLLYREMLMINERKGK